MRPKADCYECLSAIMNDLFGVVVMPLLRQPDYFFQTLASLFVLESNVGKVTPVHLIAGSADLARTWTALAQHDDAEPMHPVGKEERQGIADRSAHRRFPRNLCGAGRFSRICKYGMCVCEDNILFMDGLVDKPLVGVEEMRQAECGYVYLPFDSALDSGKEAAIAAATRLRPPFAFRNCCLFASEPLLEAPAKLCGSGRAGSQRPGRTRLDPGTVASSSPWCKNIRVPELLGEPHTLCPIARVPLLFSEPYASGVGCRGANA